MMVGNWQVSRTSWSSPLNVLQLIGQTKVRVGPKGRALHSGFARREPSSRVSGSKSRRSFGARRTAMSASPRRSKTARWFAGASIWSRHSWCSIAYRRTARRAGSFPQLPSASRVLLLTVLFWPIAWFARRRIPRCDRNQRQLTACLQKRRVGCRSLVLLILIGWAIHGRGPVRQHREFVGQVRCSAVAAADRGRRSLSSAPSSLRAGMRGSPGATVVGGRRRCGMRSSSFRRCVLLYVALTFNLISMTVKY